MKTAPDLQRLERRLKLATALAGYLLSVLLAYWLMPDPVSPFTAYATGVRSAPITYLPLSVAILVGGGLIFLIGFIVLRVPADAMITAVVDFWMERSEEQNYKLPGN